MVKINLIRVRRDALSSAERPRRLHRTIALGPDAVRDDPRDADAIKNSGDFYARGNRVKEACQEYAKAAAHYACEGSLLKAIALWKQINKLDAGALEPYVNLADLYVKQGLVVEALQVLEGALGIDPQNPELQFELARIKLGRPGSVKSVH